MSKEKQTSVLREAQRIANTMVVDPEPYQAPSRLAPSLAIKLREIWNDIHRWHEPKFGRQFGQYEELRAVTDDEWVLVKEAIVSGFPATIVPHGWVEGFALVVYEPTTPIYPGIEPDPEPVIQITASQFPGNDPKLPRWRQQVSVAVKREPGNVWERLSDLVQTEENLLRLKAEGIDPPASLGACQY